MSRSGIARVRKIAVTAVAAVLFVGLAVDPAHAVATALPTGNITTSGVEYQVFSNAVDPHFGTTDPGFGLFDAEELDTNKGDAYDGAAHLTVNNSPFKDANNSVDVSPNAVLGGTGQTVTASGKTGGVNITAKYDLFGTGNDEVMRIVYTFHNKSKKKKRSLNVAYTTNFGSDNSTVLERDTDGDFFIENDDDSWAVTSDDGAVDDDVIGDPAVTTAFGDTPNKKVSHLAFDPGGTADSIQAKFSFSLKPNKKAKLLFFQQVDDSVANAEADAPEFDDVASLTAAGLLAGVSGPFKNWL